MVYATDLKSVDASRESSSLSTPTKCEHTWPNMAKHGTRQCMRCGLIEFEYIKLKQEEAFKKINKG